MRWSAFNFLNDHKQQYHLNDVSKFHNKTKQSFFFYHVKDSRKFSFNFLRHSFRFERKFFFILFSSKFCINIFAIFKFSRPIFTYVGEYHNIFIINLQFVRKFHAHIRIVLVDCCVPVCGASMETLRGVFPQPSLLFSCNILFNFIQKLINCNCF